MIRLSSKPFETVPSAQITIDITVNLMIHCFLVLWLGPSICLSFYFLLFSLSGPQERQNSHRASSLLFLLIITRLGFLVEIRWSVCPSKSHWILFITFFGQNLVCAYTIWLYCEILIPFTIPRRSPFPPNRALSGSPFMPVYCICLWRDKPFHCQFTASLLHSLEMRSIVSFLLPRNIHLLLCCVLLVFAFI